MELFAAAVHTVIDELESAGHEIVEAEFEVSFTPNVVALKDGELLFVLIQVLLGPHIAEFSESVFTSEIIPFARAVSSHPESVVGRRSRRTTSRPGRICVDLHASDRRSG